MEYGFPLPRASGRLSHWRGDGAPAQRRARTVLYGAKAHEPQAAATLMPCGRSTPRGTPVVHVRQSA